jgi:predicted nucleic acid-binding protein
VKYLLDTNVVSEPTKPRPNSGLLAWLGSVIEESTFISTVTISELRYGIERLPAGARRTHLDDWLTNSLLARFEGRILPVDVEVADTSGRINARADFLGHPMEARDIFIAATAEVHHLSIVTRNVADFQPVLKSLLSPWS